MTTETTTGQNVQERATVYPQITPEVAAWVNEPDNRTRPLTDPSQPWTPEHCKAYPRRASEEIEYLRGQLAAERAEPLRAEAQMVVDAVSRCRYPVCKSIHASGYGWDIPRLNEVMDDLRIRHTKE